MDLSTLIYSTGAAGFFSSRAFLPAFCTALTMRFGHHFPFLGELELFQASGGEPTWFTSYATIGVLGALSALEVGATKFPAAQEALDEVYKYGKMGLAAVTTMGVLSTQEIGFIESEIMAAGILDTVWVALTTGLVWVITTLRNGFFAMISDADPDDDLGIRQLLSWFEDLWGGLGIIILFFYPVLMLGLVILTFGLLFALRKYAEYREEKKRIPAPDDPNATIYPSALVTPQTGVENPEPVQVGFFGGSRPDRPVTDRAHHAFRLVTKGRCRRCATRLPRRSTEEPCEACGDIPFGDRAYREDYVARIGARLPKTLGIAALFSLVPIFGLIPGVIYYKVSLIAPFSRYLPVMRGFLLKWLLRILFFVLIAVQAIPVAGVFVLPLMAFLSFAVYRTAFLAQARADHPAST